MANGNTQPKGADDYIKSQFEHPSKWGRRLAEGLARLDKTISKILEEQKKTKLVLGDEEVKRIVENRYKELVNIQIKEAIKGKKGIIPTINKVIGYATGGLGLLVILSALGLGVYFTNRTTTGNIITYQNKVKNLEGQTKRYEEEIKNYGNRVDSVEKSQKNYDEQLKTRFDTYEKQINDLKNEVESYKSNYEEIKASNEKYKSEIAEMNKSNEEERAKLKAEFEKKLEETERKYDGRIKKLEKAK